MSRLTVNDIMTQIASTVNQEASAPASTSAEYSLWLQYINRSVFEWANANDWEALRKIYFPTISGVSQATIAMPLDFKKLAAEPILYNGEQSQGTAYSERTDAGSWSDTATRRLSIGLYFDQIDDGSGGGGGTTNVFLLSE